MARAHWTPASAYFRSPQPSRLHESNVYIWQIKVHVTVLGLLHFWAQVCALVTHLAGPIPFMVTCAFPLCTHEGAIQVPGSVCFSGCPASGHEGRP